MKNKRACSICRLLFIFIFFINGDFKPVEFWGKGFSSPFFRSMCHIDSWRVHNRNNKNGWHMSPLVRVAHGVSLANLLSAQEGEVNRDWDLAASPHLPRVSGCGQHPITHLYHFAKPAPMSLSMWHESHSAKWNLQVTLTLWICCAVVIGINLEIQHQLLLWRDILFDKRSNNLMYLQPKKENKGCNKLDCPPQNDKIAPLMTLLFCEVLF